MEPQNSNLHKLRHKLQRDRATPSPSPVRHHVDALSGTALHVGILTGTALPQHGAEGGTTFGLPHVGRSALRCQMQLLHAASYFFENAVADIDDKFRTVGVNRQIGEFAA